MWEFLIVFYVICMAALFLIWHYYRVFSGKASCEDCGAPCDCDRNCVRCDERENSAETEQDSKQ